MSNGFMGSGRGAGEFFRFFARTYGRQIALAGWALAWLLSLALSFGFGYLTAYRLKQTPIIIEQRVGE